MEETESQTSTQESIEEISTKFNSKTLEQQPRTKKEEGAGMGLSELSDETGLEMGQMLDGQQSALTAALYRSLID